MLLKLTLIARSCSREQSRDSSRKIMQDMMQSACRQSRGPNEKENKQSFPHTDAVRNRGGESACPSSLHPHTSLSSLTIRDLRAGAEAESRLPQQASQVTAPGAKVHVDVGSWWQRSGMQSQSVA